MYSLKPIALIIFITLIGNRGLTQKQIPINGPETINFNASVRDTSINNKIKKITDSLLNKGYLSPSIHKIIKDSTVNISIENGNQFKWVSISYDNKKIPGHEGILAELRKMKGKVISPQEYSNMVEKILSTCENSGYPFATVYLDSINFITSDSISGKLSVILNKRFIFDTIKIVSQFELSQKYLQNFLDIKKGEVFDRSKVLAIPLMIENIPFVKLKDPPGVIFFGEKVSINLDLIPQKVNRFDFLLGFQRGDVNDVGKYKLTGDILAELINKIGKGERLFLNYKNLAKGRQELKIQANYPYILDMPFGAESKFEMFLNENQYRDVSFDLGLLYLMKKNNSLSVYWNRKSSRLLGIDTLKILSNKKLPDQLDISSNNIGTGITYSLLDYNFNPSGGIAFKTDINAGLRQIITNREITALEGFSAAYDSLKSKYYGINLQMGIEYYYRVARNFVLKICNNSGMKWTQNTLYKNELFRLGGLKLLRGFEENAILGDFYSVTTLEFRLLISKNSNFYVFTDYAFLRNPYSDQKKWDHPYGVGGGITFDTRAGLLQLVAATGSQYGNPLNFKNPNVHIGYTSIFK